MRSMRRKEREVTDMSAILEILQECQQFHLGLNDNGQVYIVPLNYGFEEKDGKLTIYFHSALEGRKVDLLATGAEVGFEMDCAHELVSNDELACKFTYMYKSVIGNGMPREILGDEAKIEAFKVVMGHYSPNKNLHFAKEVLDRARVYAIDVTELKAKVHE